MRSNHFLFDKRDEEVFFIIQMALSLMDYIQPYASTEQSPPSSSSFLESDGRHQIEPFFGYEQQCRASEWEGIFQHPSACYK